MTGDNPRTAKAIAEETGITEVRAEVLPPQKAEIVRDLQEDGARVAMVGDGINDAPALTQAHVGMAIGAGTDIAIESSDVVFIGHRVGAIADSITIGASSYRKTVQNLWLAFFNGLGVPLATTGLVHPSWAMIAMALSVSAVLLNSFGGRILPRRRGDQEVVGPVSNAAQVVNLGPIEQVVVKVPGIRCSACIDTITAHLLLNEGVELVKGDANRKEVTVSFHADRVSVSVIREAIRQAGYISATSDTP